MALRPVITLPDPVLRKKARKVTDFGPELHTLIEDMIDTMRAEPGVGLAAPQVGISQRVIVVEYGDDDEEEERPPKLFAVVNPEYARKSTEIVNGVEGCLSIPGYLGTVDRHESLVVKGLNKHGQPLRIKASGWLARIFQHEIDHLDGVLFVDLADNVWRPEESHGLGEPAETLGD